MLNGERLGAVAVALVVVLAGCSAAPAPPQEVAAPGSPAVPAARPLEFRWLQDSDGNVIPDFLETELGYDPLGDDCAGGGCPPVREHVVLVVDASRPLAGEDLREAVGRWALGATADRDLGLVVAGDGGRAGACDAVEVRAAPGDLTPDRVRPALPALRPGGRAPLEAALRRAGELLPPAGTATRVVLVAAGGDSCGGDPGAAVRALRDAGATVDVVGLGLVEGRTRRGLQDLAAAGGGRYTDVSRSAELAAWATGELAAVHAALLDAADCAQRGGDAGGGCYLALGDAALAAVDRERDASAGDPARLDELAALAEAIRAHAAGSSRTRPDAGAGPEQLRAAADRIAAAHRDRFGPFPVAPRATPAAARPPCRPASGGDVLRVLDGGWAGEVRPDGGAPAGEPVGGAEAVLVRRDAVPLDEQHEPAGRLHAAGHAHRPAARRGRDLVAHRPVGGGEVVLVAGQDVDERDLHHHGGQSASRGQPAART